MFLRERYKEEIAEVIYLIDAEIQKEQSPEVILDHVKHMNLQPFSPRRFRDVTGKSMEDYILSRALQNAYDVWSEDRKPLEEATYVCGISDFRKIFLERYLFQPEELRESEALIREAFDDMEDMDYFS